MLTVFKGGQATDDNWQSLIQAIAKNVCSETMTHLSSSTSTMQVAELRGYVRIRAASIAREHVRQAIAEHCMAPKLGTQLIAAVLERVVHLAVRSFFVAPISSVPTPHVQTRRAA
jgi:hypothetical protein